MDEVARNFSSDVQLGERLLCDLREFETSGRSEWLEQIVTIICLDGKKEFIHRLIFKSASPVFAKTLSEVELAGPIALDISSEILRIVIDFIYSKQTLKFSTSQVVELFGAASRFKIKGLATSIREAVDAGFLDSFLDDQDSMLGVADRDIGRVIELFNRINIETDQENRLLKKVRAWAGTDRDRLPKLAEVFDALSQMELEKRAIAEPSRMDDGIVKHLLRWLDDDSGCKLCSLRIGTNNELSFHETDRTIPVPPDARQNVINEDLLISNLGNALVAFRLDPQSAEGWTELFRLDGEFDGLGTYPDGRMFAWDSETIHWIAFVDGSLAKTRIGEATSGILSVFSIKGSSDRDPCFAIVREDTSLGYGIEFIDCHTGVKKYPLLAVPGLVYNISNDEVIVEDGDDVFLITHNFVELLDRRMLGKYGAIHQTRIIGRSKVLLLGWTFPWDGTASVVLFDDSNGMMKRSSIKIDRENLRVALIRAD